VIAALIYVALMSLVVWCWTLSRHVGSLDHEIDLLRYDGELIFRVLHERGHLPRPHPRHSQPPDPGGPP
jgi:hypothetical protein